MAWAKARAEMPLTQESGASRFATRKGWGMRFRQGGARAIQATAKLLHSSGAHPTRELAPDVGGIARAGQEQARLEHRLLGDDGDQILKFHRGNLPEMASCRDIQELVPGIPANAIRRSVRGTGTTVVGDGATGGQAPPSRRRAIAPPPDLTLKTLPVCSSHNRSPSNGYDVS